MKVWKLVSGIFSIIFFVIIMFQSCATGLANAIDENTSDFSGSAGVVVAVLALAGGIVSIATRNGGKGGNIATFVIFLLAAAIGFMSLGTFGDLVIWSSWCAICAVLALVAIIKKPKAHITETQAVDNNREQ